MILAVFSGISKYDYGTKYEFYWYSKRLNFNFEGWLAVPFDHTYAQLTSEYSWFKASDNFLQFAAFQSINIGVQQLINELKYNFIEKLIK